MYFYYFMVAYLVAANIVLTIAWVESIFHPAVVDDRATHIITIVCGIALIILFNLSVGSDLQALKGGM
jgi:hypothetical protein